MAAGFNYARSAATAQRLIEKFGQKGKLLKYVEPASSNVKPTYTTINDVGMVVLDYSTRQIDGTRIQANDRMIYVGVRNVSDISPVDRIQDATGATYEIIDPVKPLNPGGVVVFYEIQGRS
jgi:hypothetical protein